MSKTKIIATIGPASNSRELLIQICRKVDLVRLNLKHNSVEWHQNTINLIKEVSEEIGRDIKIIVDIPNSDMPIEVTGFDMIAASYIKKGTEISKLKKRAQTKGYPKTIIAKIETKGAVDNLEDIILAADGIMVARGDLGRAIEPELVNIWQKRIIEVARARVKPVIVATEMLMSMCQNLTPTRAEVSDVANAIFDGADCLMLSNETAIGQYPVESAQTLRRIATANEQSQYERRLEPITTSLMTTFLKAAADILNHKEIAGAIVFSKSGASALTLSGFRPPTPIIGISNNPEALAIMSLARGLSPVFWDTDSKQGFSLGNPFFLQLLKEKHLEHNKEYLVIHGHNWLETGTISNMSLVRFNS
ncbi:MAG: pyruvate kinase [Candidatus Shapirobacteria bacterium]